MPRRLLALAVAAAVVLLLGAGLPAAAQAPPPGEDPAATTGPPTTPAPIPPAKGLILVDADSGAVLNTWNEHEPMFPASTSKIMTMLVARDALRPEDPVTISGFAAGMPARKLNLGAGQTWQAIQLFQAALMCSCNDAAFALGEAASGYNIGGYALLAQAKAEQLGLADNPQINDPTGLDDEFSVSGGNRLSARDLAILARALLADPVLSFIVRTTDAQFDGGDGQHHTLHNTNKFLTQYPGAIGIKTGYTKKAGHSLVGAATRDGRTLIAVALDSVDPVRQVSELLDQGFAMPTPDEPSDVLPDVPPPSGVNAPSTTTTTTAPTTAPTTVPVSPIASSGSDSEVPTWLYAAIGVLVMVLAVLMVVLARRRTRRARAA